MAYSTRDQLENRYGHDNIVKWSDLDNNGKLTEIAERIAWALDEADTYIEGRLFSKFTVPFTSPYPKIIITLATLYAGILLYDGRKGDDEKDQVKPQRKEYQRLLGKILRGQLDIVDPTTGLMITKSSGSTPFVG